MYGTSMKDNAVQGLSKIYGRFEMRLGKAVASGSGGPARRGAGRLGTFFVLYYGCSGDGATHTESSKLSSASPRSSTSYAGPSLENVNVCKYSRIRPRFGLANQID